jgi:hypothetical protein
MHVLHGYPKNVNHSSAEEDRTQTHGYEKEGPYHPLL